MKRKGMKGNTRKRKETKEQTNAINTRKLMETHGNTRKGKEMQGKTRNARNRKVML